MLSATVRIVQIMDVFECRLTLKLEYPGEEDEVFYSKALTVSLSADTLDEDALSITSAVLGLLSERTSFR